MGGGWSAQVRIPTNVAHNSTVTTSSLDHSTQVINTVNISTLSLVSVLGFLGFLFLVIIYSYMRASHHLHHTRISNLARLTGFGEADLTENVELEPRQNPETV